ncbi:actin filament-associated protein 1-like isoform X2 [Clavelina lepadiformis]|uniref:actin filament-associated protein 1-like isoform X2 n=1 Tax=Clavelina lepadiformis TaxID=159417 RepID=UPI004042564F
MINMTHLELLRILEYYLDKDLRNERLSVRNESKRSELLEKVKAAMCDELQIDKLDDPLNQARSSSRTFDRSRVSLPFPMTPPFSSNRSSETISQFEGELYVDLNEGNENSAPSLGLGDGSGSGYESYASDEESNIRSKQEKEEDHLDAYYHGTNCDVYSLVFLENKTFLSGRKWIKRIGIVRENHFQCYKKLGDSHAVIDLPLRAYSAYLSSKEGTSSLVVNLEPTGSDGTAYRFYVKHTKSEDWLRTLRDKTASVVEAGSLPAPPVPSRPPNTLPPSDRPVQRQSSLIGVSDIGKGLKTAVTDMFKKDKTKKKISTAEQMGALLCGSLNVFNDGKWSKKLCLIRTNQLLIYGKEEAPEQTVILQGCDLQPSFDDQERMFAFKLTKDGKQLLFLEASSSSEMGRWVGILIAETGCAEVPEVEPESIYVEPELYHSVMSTARQVYQQTVKMKNDTKQHKKVPFPIPKEDEEDLYMDITESEPKSTLLTDVASDFKEVGPTAPPRKQKTSGAAKLNNDSVSSNSKKKESHQAKAKTKELFQSDTNMKSQIMEHTVANHGRHRKHLPKMQGQQQNSGAMESQKVELQSKIRDINNRLNQVKIKADELQKYIQAAGSEESSTRLKSVLEKTEKERKALENEKASIQRKLSQQLHLKSVAKEKPGDPKANIAISSSGNVMSRAKISDTAPLQHFCCV